MRRLLIVLGLLLVSLHGAWAQAALQVSRNDVTSKFGSSIQFTLQASAPAPVQDVALLYALGTSTDDLLAFTEAPAEFTAGTTNIDASYTRDVKTDYLPVGVTLRYKWLVTLQDGSTVETDIQSLVYQDTRFDWQERTERGITVRWYAGGDAWGAALIQSAVGGLERLEQRIGGSIKDPITITIYETTRDMRAALPPNSAEWIGGQAQPGLGLIVGAIKPGDDGELGRLVPHELSHLVLAQATRNAYGGVPVWFDEGLAVANQDTPDFGFDARVADAARNGELIPLQALASSFPADPDAALLSYAQSGSVVRYIEDTFGIDGITRLAQQFKGGVTDDTAVQAALGISLDTLDQQWRATQPAAERTPEPIAAPDVAPRDRFSGSPRPQPSSGGSSAPGASVGGFTLPIWLWAIAGLGVLLIVVGGGWIVREARISRR